jgi:hypothetical protein
MSWEWEGVPLGDTAQYAFQFAATEIGPPGILETGRLLYTLSRMDVHGNWARIWTRAGFPAPEVLNDARDSDHLDRAVTWHGVRVSGDVARSLSSAAEMATKNDMVPVPAGLLAVALLANEGAGATRTLLAGEEQTHDGLLSLIIGELLGTSELYLPGKDDDRAAPDHPHPGRVSDPWHERAARLAGGRSPDDLDLLAVLVETGAVDRPAAAALLARAHTELADTARALGTRSVSDVVEDACEEFGVVTPGAQHVLFALADRPSSALAALVTVAGLSAPQLAAGAMTELDPETATDGPRLRSDVQLWTIINLVLLLGTAVLIVRNVLATGMWWELLFLPLVFYGPPATMAWVPGIGAAGLALVDVQAAVVLAAEGLSSWLRERAERGGLTARTGVRLRLSECRSFLARRKYTAATRARLDAGLMPWRAARLLRHVGRERARTR